MHIPSYLEGILANLYAAAFFRVITGIMGKSSLCIFIKPLITGGVEMRLTYLHISSLCIYVCVYNKLAFVYNVPEFFSKLLSGVVIGTPDIIV